MKTEKMFVMIMFVIPFLLVGCEKNEIDNESFDFKIFDYRVEGVLYSKDSKLKRVYQVWSDDNKMLRAEYSYDNLGRISRSDTDYGDWKYYDLYLYNVKGQLERKSSYEKYLENPPNLRQTVTYSYNIDGNKIKELVEWEDSNSKTQTMYYLYQYDGKKLTRMETYENDSKKYYLVYEYKGDVLIKEKLFVPDDKDYVTTEHFYDQNLLVYSITYHENPKSGFMHDERKYYDHNDNLIKRIGNHPGLSSMAGATSFLVMWEYEYE